MAELIEHFLHILRLGLNMEEPESATITFSYSEWESLIDLAIKHAVIGVFAAGIERLPESVSPPRGLIMPIIARVMAIRRANERLSRACAEVSDLMARLGYQSCILKGQGLCEYYPDPLLRQPGDIDLWVRVTTDGDNRVDPKIRPLIKKIESLGKGRVDSVSYIHASWHHPANFEVEVHYRLSSFWNPIINHRMQRWSLKQWDNLCLANGYYRPNPLFNVVFMIVHIFKHLKREGIGIRQIMDLALLLNHCDFSESDVAEIQHRCRYFHVYRFACGLMWVVNYFFKVPVDKLVATPNENYGRFLSHEIIIGGNFGKYDPRFKRPKKKHFGAFFWKHTKHTLLYLSKIPGEAFFDLYFRSFSYLWKFIYNLKSS